MKSININGIEYVQKKELDDFKKSINKKYIRKDELNKIKSSVLTLNHLVGINDTELKTPASKKEIKKQHGRPTDDTVFTPSKSLMKQDLKIIGVTKDGYFLKSTGHATSFKIKDVKVLKQYLTKQTTFGDLRKFAQILNITPVDCRLIAYNIQKGTFDKFLGGE